MDLTVVESFPLSLAFSDDSLEDVAAGVVFFETVFKVEMENH
jgi:hypothetical protein